MHAQNIAHRIVLPIIAEYHDGESLDARKILIQEMFVPLRVTSSGMRRVPVQLPVKRRVELRSGHSAWWGRTRSIGLARVELDVRGDPAQALRCPVVMAIETCIPGLWWRFHARVTRVRRQGRRLTVRIERTLGCEVHPLRECST